MNRRASLREGAEVTDKPGSKMLAIVDAADILGCTPGTLRVWVSQRKVPHYKVRGLVRFRRDDLEEFLQGCLVRPEQVADIESRSEKLSP
jgi:excisionase family DNA binding protein